MSVQLWSGDGPVLADTSAWIVARRIPAAQELLQAAVERGDVAWCWPVRYELMIDARGAEGIAVVDRALEGLRQLVIDRAVQRGVLALMRELAATEPHGTHRMPLTDLTVAVAAQQAGRALVHHDRRFDRLDPLLGIRAPWIADPSG